MPAPGHSLAQAPKSELDARLQKIESSLSSIQDLRDLSEILSVQYNPFLGADESSRQDRQAATELLLHKLGLRQDSGALTGPDDGDDEPAPRRARGSPAARAAAAQALERAAELAPPSAARPRPASPLRALPPGPADEPAPGAMDEDLPEEPAEEADAPALDDPASALPEEPEWPVNPPPKPPLAQNPPHPPSAPPSRAKALPATPVPRASRGVAPPASRGDPSDPHEPLVRPFPARGGNLQPMLGYAGETGLYGTTRMVGGPRETFLAIHWFTYLAQGTDPSVIFLYVDYYREAGWYGDAEHAWLERLALGLATRRAAAKWTDYGLDAKTLAHHHLRNLRVLDKLFGATLQYGEAQYLQQTLDALLEDE